MVFDLEKRTFEFAKRTRGFIRALPRSITNAEDARQLARSSGSVHANFIEFSDAISAKDALHRLKICRKEAKESKSWLDLIDTESSARLDGERSALAQEAVELMRIFGSIITKKVQKQKL